MATGKSFLGGIVFGSCATSLLACAYAIWLPPGSNGGEGVSLKIRVEAAERRAIFTIINSTNKNAYLFDSCLDIQCFRVTPEGRQFVTTNPETVDMGPPGITSLLVVPAGGSIDVPVPFDEYRVKSVNRLEKFQGVITGQPWLYDPAFKEIADQFIKGKIESSVVLAH